MCFIDFFRVFQVLFDPSNDLYRQAYQVFRMLKFELYESVLRFIGIVSNSSM